VNFKPLDVIVRNGDRVSARLKDCDLGTVVELNDPSGLRIEFVTPSSKLEALVTLDVADVRSAFDTELTSVRPDLWRR
jgi:hypothetical protein